MVAERERRQRLRGREAEAVVTDLEEAGVIGGWSGGSRSRGSSGGGVGGAAAGEVGFPPRAVY